MTVRIAQVIPRSIFPCAIQLVKDLGNSEKAMKNRLLGMLFFCGLVVATTVSANEPGWSGTVIARGVQREQIEAMNILDRPYRPLHFYGNTVRRRYYRSHTLPNVRDVANGSAASAQR